MKKISVIILLAAMVGHAYAKQTPSRYHLLMDRGRSFF